MRARLCIKGEQIGDATGAEWQRINQLVQQQSQMMAIMQQQMKQQSDMMMAFMKKF